MTEVTASSWRSFHRDFVLPAVLLPCAMLPFAAAVQWAGGTPADGMLAAVGWMVAFPLCYWLPVGAFLYRWPRGWFTRLLAGYLVSIPVYFLALFVIYPAFGSAFHPRSGAEWGIYFSATATYFLMVYLLQLIVRRGGRVAGTIRLLSVATFVVGAMAPVVYLFRVDRYEWPANRRAPSVITNARIVDPEGNRIVEGMNVHLRDGRIIAIVAAAQDSAPAGETLDARGAYLLPGLSDVHSHLLVPIRDLPAGFRLGYFAEALFSRYADHRRAYLEHGVTTVRDLGGSAPLAFALRRALRERRLLGPRLFVVGRLVTAPGGHPVGTIWPKALARPGAIQAADTETLAGELQRDSADGPVDAVKFVYGTIGRPVPRLDSTLLRHGVAWATQHKLISIVHAETAEEVATAAAIATGVEHVASIAMLSPELLAQLVRYRPFVSPTFGELRVASRLQRMPAAEVESLLAVRRGYVKRIYDAGVPLAVGTDAPLVPYGAGLLDELDDLIRAGLRPAEVLTIATINNAAYLGQSGALGRVAPGYAADLLLVGDNPLNDLRALRAPRWVLLDGVVVAGQEVDRQR